MLFMPTLPSSASSTPLDSPWAFLSRPSALCRSSLFPKKRRKSHFVAIASSLPQLSLRRRLLDCAAMSSTTPLLPLELPPYSLQSLVTSVFASPPAPTLPSKPPGPGSPANPLGRFGQFVSDAASSVAGSEGAAAKAGVIKAVEASQERVWVGGNDGRIRIYGAGEGTLLETGPTSGRSTPSSTSRIPRVRSNRRIAGISS